MLVYSQSSTFMRIPKKHQLGTDLTIVGVPYDGGTSNKPGARFGPEAIRASSKFLRPYSNEYNLNVLDLLKPYDYGDLEISIYSMEKTFSLIEETIKKLPGKIAVLGGDHSITLPILRAIHSRYFDDLVLLHFDAHSDTCGIGEDTIYHHGNVIYHVIEEKLINSDLSAQIGLRATSSHEGSLNYAKSKINIITRDDICSNNLQFLNKLLNKIKGKPIYITFDIDVIDPAFAPGTGTPEPGGVSSSEILMLLKRLRGQNIVGFDICEVSPPFDLNSITASLAAKIVYEIISLMAFYKNSSQNPSLDVKGSFKD